jgi:hypothetical protein
MDFDRVVSVEEGMPDGQLTLTSQKLKTPRAAAIAGIVVAVLFVSSIVPIRLSIPPNPSGGGVWLKRQAGTVRLALTLVPFAGIAALWFIGLVRDRRGDLEDQCFSTVSFGSGLLFLAMTFASAALACSTLAIHTIESSKLIDSGVYTFARAVMYRFTNVYAIKMAGVFMISLATIWLCTGVMPRWLAFLTFALALLLLVSISPNLWVTLLFPGWVCLVSLYVLALNLRSPSAPKMQP